jgi:hypothetical protein
MAHAPGWLKPARNIAPSASNVNDAAGFDAGMLRKEIAGILELLSI